MSALQRYHAPAAVLLVLLLVVMLVFGLLFTWAMVQARQSELGARETQLEALKRRAAQPAPAQQGRARSLEPFFADGFALAANALQKRVVGLIESAGGTLVSVGIDPQVTTDDEPGRRVVVQAVAELGNEALQEVLYRLEADAPFVFIETLTVNRIARRGAGDAQEEQGSPTLSVDLRAAGYFRRSAP